MTRTAVSVMLAALGGLTGCNAVFGLDPPAGGDVDADLRDAVPGDGPEVDARICGTHDEDGDGVADGCDNCPHVFNADQANDLDGGSDQVGDVCDPHPTLPRDILLRFDAFDIAPPDMSVDMTAGETPLLIGGDRLIDTDANVDRDVIARFPVGTSRVTVQTRAQVLGLTEPSMGHSASLGIWGAIDDGTTPGFPGGVVGEIGVEVGIVRNEVTHIVDTKTGMSGSGMIPPPFQAGVTATITVTVGGVVFADITAMTIAGNDRASILTGIERGDSVGLRTHGASVGFDYLVVYGVDP